MLGCRLNQSEIDTMARQFEQQGHTIVEDSALADQIIINTCAVTNDAVKSGRKMIAEANRSNPNAQITVTGCHAQLAPQELAKLQGVVRLVSNQDKDSLVQQITGIAPEPYDLEPHERDQKHVTWRTRAFIKVQDGCDNACTFCITTVARGQGRSRKTDDILHEIQHLHSIGYQEAILTGVHLGSYEHDCGNPHGLAQLVERILSETTIPRLRLSSLEPWDLSPDFFTLWDNERLCPHLHLPLQSGCDATLKRMRRNTTTHDFAALVAEARRSIPDVRITTDLIVGFPSETDEEFAQSLEFVKATDFAGMHVFRYSRREGTPAARMRGTIPDAVKKERSHQMLSLAKDGEERFAQQFVGTRLPVLWENVAGATPQGFVNVGYTHNYLRVQAVHPRVLTNLTTPMHIISVNNGVLYGEAVIE